MWRKYFTHSLALTQALRDCTTGASNTQVPLIVVVFPSKAIFYSLKQCFTSSPTNVFVLYIVFGSHKVILTLNSTRVR